MSKTKRLALCAVLISLALALSYTERFLPLQLLIGTCLGGAKGQGSQGERQANCQKQPHKRPI